MPHILLVDDDSAFRKMLRLTLQRMGYEITEACDGKQALGLYKQLPVDAVLTDLIMPEKEGLETITELHRIDPNVRIVAMSGGGRLNAKDILSVARAMGADHVLAKPFSDEELVTALNSALAA
jgi:two-component system, chemotaxis family, chemotaxis protein CheY